VPDKISPITNKKKELKISGLPTSMQTLKKMQSSEFRLKDTKRRGTQVGARGRSLDGRELPLLTNISP
jgi:hypothetical protein